ncbi:hypothetical protein PM3016_5237 [Paenibacillus mucilaginosus 3016]|uniref:Uncharacterized protein n=1 Tax=Paenibacillus mucilaginosus 3016 TaxID=1116391 RepID=H6NQV7_9BACL|nr:hypothetical protein PM3016_5237 [Paenibacillus mucilaginosus 3016]
MLFYLSGGAVKAPPQTHSAYPPRSPHHSPQESPGPWEASSWLQPSPAPRNNQEEPSPALGDGPKPPYPAWGLMPGLPPFPPDPIPNRRPRLQAAGRPPGRVAHRFRPRASSGTPERSPAVPGRPAEGLPHAGPRLPAMFSVQDPAPLQGPAARHPGPQAREARPYPPDEPAKSARPARPPQSPEPLQFLLKVFRTAFTNPPKNFGSLIV